MSKRIPSPELVRFLVNRYPLSGKSLGEIQIELSNSTEQVWQGFDSVEIRNDLELAIEHRGSNAIAKNTAKPVVLCLFDDGQQGKTTFANLLLKQNIPVFPTDRFVACLRGDWHNESAIQQLAKLHVPNTVDQFIEKIQADQSLSQSFLTLFFDPTHGFNLTAPVSVIEGFLYHPHHPNPVVRLDGQVGSELRRRGYKVWTATKLR